MTTPYCTSKHPAPNAQVVEFPLLGDTYSPTQPEIGGIQLKTTTRYHQPSQLPLAFCCPFRQPRTVPKPHPSPFQP